MSTPRWMPPDQAARDRFAEALDRNLSVVAAAGVGKTTAVTARVVRWVQRQALLPEPTGRLAVVTYTNAAAREMEERVYATLAQETADPLTARVLDEVFFGTIHGFAAQLLRDHGQRLGWTSAPEVTQDVEVEWRRFAVEAHAILRELPPEGQRDVRVLLPWDKVLALAEKWPLGEPPPPGALPPVPCPDFADVYAVEATGRSAQSIATAQAQLREGEALLNDPDADGVFPWPDTTKGGKDFIPVLQTALAPLGRWRGEAAAWLAGRLGQAFAGELQARGIARFEDLIAGAAALLDDPATARIIRRVGWSVILDEAQDTDAAQFAFLTGLTRAADATGDWLAGEPGADGPEPGRFCMVGDGQQLIYSSRADLATYRGVHEKLVQSPGGEALVFDVTFRLPPRLVAWLNGVFPAVLTGAARPPQALYTPLTARETDDPGQVERLLLPTPPDWGDKVKQDVRLRAYVEMLAHTMQAWTPVHFGAARWGDIAWLCPRNSWAGQLAAALHAVGLPVNLQARNLARREDPVHAWIAGLVQVMAAPDNLFEATGVWREVFGVSDAEIFAWLTRQRAGDLQPEQAADFRQHTPPAEDKSPVADILRLFADVHGQSGPSLVEGFANLQTRLQLKARLVAVLGPARGEQVEATLGHYQLQAVALENDRAIWADWAAKLQREATTPPPADEGPADPARMSVLSCHKAKGLGWPVVVLPFLFAEPGFRTEHYPRLYRDAAGVLQVAFTRDDESATVATTRRQNQVAELERLAYVALTRAKQRVILLDDVAWWGDKAHAFGHLLGLSDGTDAGKALATLPEAKPLDDRKTADQGGSGDPAAGANQKLSSAAGAPLPRVFSLTPAVLATAKKIGLRRRTPSSLADHRAPPARQEPDRHVVAFPDENPKVDGAAYGNWWHGSMETLPWTMPDVWHAHLEARVEHGQPPCPEALFSRGRQELGQFLASPLAEELAGAELVEWG